MRAAVALRCGMTEAEARRERSREEGITRNVAGWRDPESGRGEWCCGVSDALVWEL